MSTIIYRQSFQKPAPSTFLTSSKKLARKKTKRAAFDYYPTPPQATRALLSVEKFDGTIWEPACGEGHISKVLQDHGHDVVSTDLIDRGFGQGGTNFLRQTTPRAKHIITNPPYGLGLGDQFIRQALLMTRQTDGSVAMMLNLASLCHPSRHKKFIKTPPAMIYAIDQLVCWPNGDKSQAGYRTAQHRYCWAIWQSDYTGPTKFGWLSMAGFQ